MIGDLRRFGRGPRADDDPLLTGRGTFTDDLGVPGQAHAAFVRAPLAHARIAGVDTAAALAMPGVLAVYTGRDLESDGLGPIPPAASFPGRGGKPMFGASMPVLAAARVRYVGEPLAMVVASTAAQAQDAAEQLEPQFDALPSVSDVERATSSGAPVLWDEAPGNVALDGTGRNSPFTTALLAHIGEAGQDIHAVMRKVRSDVVAATGETQVPWENSSLVSEVYLASDAGPGPVAEPPVEPQADAQYSYVGGLDPNGDGFLALRTGTGNTAQRIARMTEGTMLEVLGSEGEWNYVRLLDGREGWAHSRWIRCCTSGNTPTPRAEAAASCDDHWYQRNAIWATYGYCFTSARGLAAFGNAGCFRNQAQAQAAMSGSERDLVDRIKATEAAQGCR